MTLLWYPRIRQDSDTWSLGSFSWAMAEKSLLPSKESSPGFQRYSSPQDILQPRWQRLRKLPRPLLHQSKQPQNGKAKEACKRQISQAIPRNKRDNDEVSRPDAAPASSRSTQEGTQVGIQEGIQEGTLRRHSERHSGGHPQVSVRAQAKNALLE